MKTYKVNAWISTGYTFIVKANNAEEAKQKVKDGEIAIDYDKLSKECYWDFGDIYLDDVIEIDYEREQQIQSIISLYKKVWGNNAIEAAVSTFSTLCTNEQLDVLKKSLENRKENNE